MDKPALIFFALRLFVNRVAPGAVGGIPGHVKGELGAFGAQGNAEASRQRMQSLASSNDVEGRLELVNRDGLYKVRIGPFVTVSRAREVAERLNVQTVVMR